MRLFSYRNRPVHLGPYPSETLKRVRGKPDFIDVPPMRPLTFPPADDKTIASAIGTFLTMLDAIREGPVWKSKAEIPEDPVERADHLKAAGYFFDATVSGTCALPREALLDEPIRNPALDALAEDIAKGQTKTFASGIDVVIADVRESARRKPTPIDQHTHAIVFLVEFPRDPDPGEPGGEWIAGTQYERAAVRAGEAAIVLANYLRILGYEARGHTASSSDVDLNRLALAAGVVERTEVNGEVRLSNPYIGTGFGLAAVTTTMELAPDEILAPQSRSDRLRSHGPSWWLGKGTLKSATNRLPYRNRAYVQGLFPLEKMKTRDEPTTFIDAERVARVPKRADFFARALFGDLGPKVQEHAKGGRYVLENPMGYCSRRTIGALVLLQDGEVAPEVSPGAVDPKTNADNVKASLYYLGADAVGLSEAPAWTWYSHDAAGQELVPYHKNAISILVDQGHETMDGTSGDDWISATQSMRAYLRTSLIGGIVAEKIRRLGYSARVHSVLDGEVLQPPLLLLSGLGEVSRIGEVILNPFLGPRLKSGVVTTDMPFAFDKPIDFGLQKFCENCDKCARECPSGAITAGPKLMFNGYEIWKSDSEKCARYRITNPAGSMCGRCMKTCPWNLEGLFKEAPFRWAAMNIPSAAKHLAKLDDWIGNGSVNPVKTWWWDIELDDNGEFVKAEDVNARPLSLELDLKYEDQTLAVYPAALVPPPYPISYPIDREAGIAAYQSLLSPHEYKHRLSKGEVDDLVPQFSIPDGPPPVFPVKLTHKQTMASDVDRYEFQSLNGEPLPTFKAGAHIDVVIAPEYLRQYSLAGDPADRSKYVLGVLAEHDGRGGSKLMNRAFTEGRKVFISRPHNHFPLHEDARRSYLFAGGIGVTPLIAMAHRLHNLGRDFTLYYCCASRETAGFLEDLASYPWANRVEYHFKSEGNRAVLSDLIDAYQPTDRIYTCGPARFMEGVFETAAEKGWPDDACHREFFSVPDENAYENFIFRITLAKSGKTFDIPAERSATDVLNEAGIHVDTKCSDGLCGVCATHYTSGEVEHRDFVLSAKEREEKMILCCSRAKDEGGEIVLDL